MENTNETPASQPKPASSLRLKILAISREVPPIIKTGKNPVFKGTSYVKLEDLVEAISPTLQAHKVGYEITQAKEYHEGFEGLTITVFDEDTNEERSYTKYVPLEKNNAQGVGSADTYLRRYLLTLIFNLKGDDDDDGNAASSTPSKAAREENKAQQAPAAAPVPAVSDKDAFFKNAEEVALEIAAKGGFDKPLVMRWLKANPKRNFVDAIGYKERFLASLETFKAEESVY